MPKKVIVTPVMEFWGFKTHPFQDLVLAGSDLELFVGREGELRRLYNSLSSTLCGAYGLPGVGKSSLLGRLKREVEKGDYKVVVVEMAGVSETLIFRLVLASVLETLKKKELKAPKLPFDVDQELSHLVATLRKEASIGVQLGLDAFLRVLGGVKESDETEIPPHTEESALAQLAKLVEHVTEPFVILVDNLERVRTLIGDDERYFRFVSRFARTVDEELRDKGVCVVVSLDQSSVEHTSGGRPSDYRAAPLSFGSWVPVLPFALGELKAAISVRLARLGGGVAVDKFITPDGFLTLAVTSEGHPRRALAVIREAMELIAAERAPLQLTSDYVRRAALNRGEKVDDVELKIFKFLSDGKHSPSEEAFSKSVGIAGSTLRPRLARMAERGILYAEQVQDGRAGKMMYSLPSFE